MKKICFLFLISVCLNVIVKAQDNHDPNLGIIPAPVSATRDPGHFNVNKYMVIIAKEKEGRHVAAMLNDMLKQRYGFSLPVKTVAGKDNIVFELKPGSEPKEGYSLIIKPTGIIIKAGDGAGLFYGMQSLLQLMPTEKSTAYAVPCADIKDYPRFPYRGMHLDCGRHFFPVSFIKEYIDLMSRYKINTFHWHLTEDQGWRIEIKRYPKLTEVGSHRSETVIGHNSGVYDGQPEGGYYTQDQIRDVVKYAAARYVTIIPEIEMPGHAQAALAAYPWLGCVGFGPTYQVWDKWGVTPNVFCAGKDSTFTFLENVLTEVMQLFPSHYIHIGGDECPKDHWKLCPDCQKRMKELGLTTEDQLQSYFIQRIEKFLNAHGRDIIGWDEILEGGLAPNATVMSWRGEQGGIAAAKQHHNVIMTPGEWLYFDHGQGDREHEPTNIGGYLPLSKVYSYNPVPAALSPDEQKYIIGMQANVWTEYMPTSAQVEYMVFPRMLALAEDAWTPLDKKDYTDFEKRLPDQLTWLDREHVHFRIPEPYGLQSDTTLTTDSAYINLRPLMPGTKIYYTLDGSIPITTSREFIKPFNVPLPQGKSIMLNCIEVTPSGNTSVDYWAKFTHP
jgi:hexosaminidase